MEQLHPFHYRQAQDFTPQDWPLSIQFCQLPLNKQVQSFCHILPCDEALQDVGPSFGSSTSRNVPPISTSHI